MTSIPPTNQQIPQYTAKLLEAKKIKKVAIIDDAYDLRSESEFYANEIVTFWTQIDFDDTGAKEEFITLISQKLGRKIQRVKDIDDQVLQLLWESRDEMKKLKAPVEDVLFPKIVEKMSQLDRFDKHLEGELKLEVIRKGTNVDVEGLKDVSIVFIDYVLGNDEDLKGSVDRAEKIALRIYEAYSGGGMPLIILMSSFPGAAAEEEGFREKSNLIKGMFYFAPKAELGDRDRLLLNIAAWAKALPLSVDIQRFVKTLEQSSFSVFREFISGVKSLSLEDYAYVQHLSLQHDGHPLGDYMLWLYSSYLGHLLFEKGNAMKEQQSIVNGLKGNYLPPNQTMPSAQLARMYHSALFNTSVGEVAAHPVMAAEAKHTEETDKKASVDLMPYLHLGDILIKEGDDHVLMVLNAECDLAFGPARQCDADGMILFVMGELQPPEKWGEGSAQIRTEFFEYENKRYRIIWDIKKVFSYPYREIDAQLTSKGYERRARLRLPFALEVQRAFAANLTRIGVPVAPPIYHTVRLELLAREEGEKAFTLMEARDNLAFWVLIKTSETKYEKLFFFTLAFGHLLKHSVNAYIAKLEEIKRNHAETTPDDDDRSKSQKALAKKVKKLEQRVQELRIFKEGFDSWFLELKPIHLEKGSTQLESTTVGLGRGGNVNAAFKESQPILINIVEREIDKADKKPDFSPSLVEGVIPEPEVKDERQS